MNAYQLRKLGHALRHGSARVVGRVSGGARWPDPPHLWIVEDLGAQCVQHVPCASRPRWARYAKAAREGVRV